MLFHGRVVFSAQPLAFSQGAFTDSYKQLEEKLLGSNKFIDLSEIINDKQSLAAFSQGEVGQFPMCFVEFLNENNIRKLISFMLSESEQT